MGNLTRPCKTPLVKNSSKTQESGTMEDYHSWLDNIAAADMRASKYFVDKVTPSFSSNSSC